MVSVAPARPVQPGDERFRTGPAQVPPATQLSEIPFYQMQADTLVPTTAATAASAEIERLHTLAKTLDSGPLRRSLETRIYHFEKRLRPLASQFDAAVWEKLRADLRAEWTLLLAAQVAAPIPSK